MNHPKMSSRLKFFSQFSKRIYQLVDWSNKPETFYGDFEEFEFQRAILFEDLLQVYEKCLIILPEHYKALFGHLDNVRANIKNPFVDHEYWTREALVA